MNKALFQRVALFSFIILSSGLLFQNCSQPGAINLSGQQLTNANNELLKTPVSDPITLISSPSVSINKGAKYTQIKEVNIELVAGGAEEMQISDGETCLDSSNWIPFTQNKSWTLKNENAANTVAVKFRKKGVPETSCFQALITHDNTPPAVALTDQIPAYTNSSSGQINFSAQDNISGIDIISCQQPNAVEEKCESSYIFNMFPVDGTYSLTIKAKDLAGNESAPLTTTFVVDRLPPEITINGPQGAVASQNLKYDFQVKDMSGFKEVLCRLTPVEVNFKDCSSLKAEYVNMVTGQYQFEVKATDLANNSSSKSQSVEIDLSVPTVTITKNPLSYINIKTANFEFSGLSGTKVIKKFMCSMNGGAATSCSSPLVLNDLQDGIYNFSVVGINDLNVSSAPQNYKFTVDTVAPVISILSGPSMSSVQKNNSISISLDAKDSSGIKSISCNLNGQISDCTAKSITFKNLANGPYSFTAKAIDQAGNQTETTALTWTIDTTPDSQILATFDQNPVKEGTSASLNINLISVTQASYNCVNTYTQQSLAKANITTNTTQVALGMNSDVTCTVSGLDKKNMPIVKVATAEVNCGNKQKSNGQCVDFKCTSVVNLPPYSNSNTVNVPARTGDGICYAMKIFDAIARSDSGVTLNKDLDIVSRWHGGAAPTFNPYQMNKALVNFKLLGPRVVKLTGGLNATSPILADNFLVVGLYPQVVSTPVISQYTSYGSADSTVPGTNYVLFKNQQLPLTPFASGGTATITPLEIVREADTDLNYNLDVRALDCGGIRELSDMYLLFQ